MLDARSCGRSGRTAVLALALSLIAACAGGDSGKGPVEPPGTRPTPPADSAVASFTLTLPIRNLIAGDTGTTRIVPINAAGQPLQVDTRWNSSDTRVATVDATGNTAVVTAVSAGSTAITASAGGLAVTQIVRVAPRDP